MLVELKQAHKALLGCIDELELLTSADVPDQQKLASVRWKLSRESVQRRRLVEAACDWLMTGATQTESARVAALRDDSAATVAESSRHVGTWTMDRIIADWDGYRAASATMRTVMRRRIKQEQQTLYPLLERAAA